MNRPASDLYRNNNFGMEIRTYYRRYREEKIKMGVVPVSRRKWETKNKNMLADLAGKGLSLKDINIEGKSKSAIRTKAERENIGIEKEIYVPWTDEENALLEELLARDVPLKKIWEEYFKDTRSYASVAGRVRTLKKREGFGNKRNTDN